MRAIWQGRRSLCGRMPDIVVTIVHIILPGYRDSWEHGTLTLHTFILTRIHNVISTGLPWGQPTQVSSRPVHALLHIRPLVYVHMNLRIGRNLVWSFTYATVHWVTARTYILYTIRCQLFYWSGKYSFFPMVSVISHATSLVPVHVFWRKVNHQA